MVDYFALLNFPRTPWLAAEQVQKRFLELSAPVHPDRVHHLGAAEKEEANRKFAELNKAATVLRDQKERLQHLIALESGPAAGTAQTISGEFVELFGRVGEVCRKVDLFLSERAKATSPMVQAQLFGKGLDLSDAVSELQAKVAEVKGRAEGELKEISERWREAKERKELARVAELAHVFAMVSKWEAQLRERFAALAAG
jgi:DnaJ-class molecular chaperone